MDNGAASNELLQSLQPTHNESVKNNDRIEGETLKKLINRNFRSKNLVSIKTDYEAANIKVVDAITNRNCQSAQDVIKNIEAIMSYNNVINPVYLIHGTAEVQLEYLRSILDSNIPALLKIVVPDWLQTDVAIKLNTQTDITECREAITELVLNNADKFSRKRSSDSLSNNGEKFPMKKNHAVPNHNSHNRIFNDAQADKIRAAILPELKGDSKVNLTKIRNSFIVYRFTKGYCLNCGRSNHKTSNCRLDPVDSKVDPSDDAVEQVLPNRYSKRVFYSNMFTVPKPENVSTSSSSRFKKVKLLHQQPIIQNGRNKESTTKLLKVIIHIRLIVSLSTSSNLYERSGVLSILELTSLDDSNSRVCPLSHLETYLGASEGRRKPHSGYSVFINNEGQPLKKMVRWKSNYTVDTFYDKRIIGEKSCGFLNTVVQIS
ncbi:hypothetical protein ACTFIY_004990 [Dictyostelium cf. discoideum]